MRQLKKNYPFKQKAGEKVNFLLEKKNLFLFFVNSLDFFFLVKTITI
jgi:hypothetical protein